jgi:hypothetical protein
MPRYHATWASNLESITRHGLGGASPDTRNFDCDDGVYLAEDPAAAICFLIEAAVRNEGFGATPADAFKAMRLIVIDDSRYDASLAEPDPHVERAGIAVIYRGVIDVRGLPVIDAETAIAGMKNLPAMG